MITLYILLHIIPPFTSWLRGIYISAQTARKDYPSNSWIWLYKRIKKNKETIGTANLRYRSLLNIYDVNELRLNIMMGSSEAFDMWDLWYIGGNDYYPRPDRVLIDNHNDFWHRCRTIWASLITYTVLSSLFLGAAVMASGFIYGFTTLWCIDTVITCVIISCSTAIQETIFSRVYGIAVELKAITGIPKYILSTRGTEKPSCSLIQRNISASS